MCEFVVIYLFMCVRMCICVLVCIYECMFCRYYLYCKGVDCIL